MCISIGVLGPATAQLIPQLKDAEYTVYDINGLSLQHIPTPINTIVFAEDLMPLHWALRLSWHNTRRNWRHHPPYLLIEATSLFEFEHQLAIAADVMHKPLTTA